MGYGNTQVYLTAGEREELIREYLGRTVTVEVDRPIGYVHHTKGITLHYTVNYGYLPGVTGGDGEEQDVYILGVDKPVERFTGRIIAAVRRADDNEDKLVAAPEGLILHQGQIAEAIHFVEQYFDSSVDAVYQKSCGVIPYRRVGEKTEYLLLRQRRSGYWSFPKGHMEAWEGEQETALRELREETGLSAAPCPGFRGALQYKVSRIARKEVILFLGEVTREPVLEDSEIVTSRWVTMTEAKAILGRIYHPVLEKAQRYLQKQGGGHG